MSKEGIALGIAIGALKSIIEIRERVNNAEPGDIIDNPSRGINRAGNISEEALDTINKYIEFDQENKNE